MDNKPAPRTQVDSAYHLFGDLALMRAESYSKRLPDLLRVDNEKTCLWYMKATSTQLWSKRELERPERA